MKVIDIDLVKGPIHEVAGVIAGDLAQGIAESGGRLTNTGFVEACIDANRITFHCRDRAAAQAAEDEVTRAIAAHGYDKVLRVLARAIKLV